jgi:hypothetical protein
MQISERLTLPMTPTDVAAMYADPQYADVRATTLGAREGHAEPSTSPDGSLTVRTTLEMPAPASLPDLISTMLRGDITAEETQTWSAPGPDGQRTGTMELTIRGVSAGLSAQLVLSPLEGERAQVGIDGDVFAKIPLIGKKLEKAAAPYISKVLRAEERAAAAYRDRNAA